MANFYWQGQSITGIAKFDWNNRENWKQVEFNSSGTGSSFGWRYIDASYSPGPNDAAIFGAISEGGGALQPLNALSPCLFGGYSGNVAFGSWLGAAVVDGTTGESSLITLSTNLTRSSSGSNRYPFALFGTGLSGDTLNYLFNVEGISGVSDSDLVPWAVAPSNHGFTSGVSGGLAMVARSRNPLKLKVRDTYMLSHDADKLIKFVGVKSLVDVVGTTGNTKYVRTNLWSFGKGTLSISSGVFQNINNYGVGSSLYLNGLTCGTLSTVPTSVFVEPNCKFNRVSVAGQYTNPIWFGGTLDTASVINELGIAGLGTTGVNQAELESGIDIQPIYQWWTGGGLQSQPYFVFGIPGPTSQQAVAKRIRVSSVDGGASGSSTGTAAWNSTWNLTFGGGASAATIESTSAIIRVQNAISTATSVNIGTLFMDKSSVLDLASGGEFDNWFFGSLSGNSIQGGIIFRDEDSLVKGSQGIRLFNTQVVLGNRYDVRGGKVTQQLTEGGML